MNRFKLILADDEPASREGLQQLLSKDKTIDVVAVCTNGIEAIQAIEVENPHILLLDIQMPEVSGFDVLRSLCDPLPQVIFITAYDQYAIKAFENQALDYLLKPFSDERFYLSLERAKEQVRLNNNQETSDKLQEILSHIKPEDSDRFIGSLNATGPMKKLVVKTSGKILIIPWHEIRYIEADDYVVRVNYASQIAVVRESLKNMEQLLPDSQFMRVHKSFIVNIEKISEIEKSFSGGLILVLPDKTHIPVSRNYRSSVVARLGIN